MKKLIMIALSLTVLSTGALAGPEKRTDQRKATTGSGYTVHRLPRSVRIIVHGGTSGYKWGRISTSGSRNAATKSRISPKKAAKKPD